jgi:acid phosphatase class B
MYIIYRKLNKKVEMLSDGKIKYDKNIFAEKEMSLTDKEYNDIINSEEAFYKNGKLNIKPKINNILEKQKLEQELENATDISKVKEIIKKLINL